MQVPGRPRGGVTGSCRSRDMCWELRTSERAAGLLMAQPSLPEESYSFLSFPSLMKGNLTFAVQLCTFTGEQAPGQTSTGSCLFYFIFFSW